MSDVFGPASMAVGQSVSAFMSFLPPLSTVRKASRDDDPEIAADVRLGEVAATAITLGLGAITASLTGSAVPMYSAIFMAAVIICIYESSLRADRPFEAARIDKIGVVRDA